MVKLVTAEMSLTGNGLRDWIAQRFSAVVIGLYFLALCYFFFTHPHLNYNAIRVFFSNPGIQIFTLLTLFCLLIHAWIGMMVIVSDYVKNFALRFFIQLLFLAALFIYFFWGVIIFWRLG